MPLVDYTEVIFGGWKQLKTRAVFHCNSGSAQLSAHWSLTNAEEPPSWISRQLGMLGKEIRFQMAACSSFFFVKSSHFVAIEAYNFTLNSKQNN